MADSATSVHGGGGSRWAARGLVLSGAVCVGVAAFHAFAIVEPTVSEASPAWRHGLFVAVNLFFAAAFLRRSRWIAWPFVALAGQQLWSHGSAFLEARRAGHVDVQSLLVLGSLPPLAWCVWLGRAPNRRP